jgi:hypothetical protein
MKVYNFVNIENQEVISNKLYDYIVNQTNILETKYDWNTLKLKEVKNHVPELFVECAKLINHPIDLISVIHRSPEDQGKIHIDDGPSVYRLLWPVKNCQGSYTKFFDIGNNQVKLLHNPNGNKFLTIEQKYPFTEIASVELTQPLVFNTKIAHGVYPNPDCNGPRLSITIGFGQYPIENYLM